MACNTSGTSGDKLRVLLIPFLSTSHIQPITELAIHLAAANEAVEATVAVTPANVSIVRSLLEHRGQEHHNVKIATYPFPMVEGIPKGVENMAKASTPEVSLSIDIAVSSEHLMRPLQETLVRTHAPDAIVTDMLCIWNGRVADKAGVPCVAFSSMGAFSTLAIRHLMEVAIGDHNEVPGFPGPLIRIPRSELPVFFRIQDYSFTSSMDSLQANCFGLAMNTSSDLEKQYCEMYMRRGYVKRAYFVGPLALGPAAVAGGDSECYIMDWLDSKPHRSVVYLSFGSLAQFKDAQLDEIALGLETSGKSFLWVVRGKEEWSPPNGLGLQHRGLIIRAWAPQTAILRHAAVGAFVTHCGWNSILETVAAGVPVLTWPGFYEQFITERQVTEVLGIGQRLWPDGAGIRSERPEEHEVVPAADVARALTTFMRPGGPGDAARIKVMDLAKKVHTAVAEGGSSHRDLHHLVDDLMEAKIIPSRRSKI